MVQAIKAKRAEVLQAKIKKRGGFTLVELLIVVAIIAILAAIAIPLYSAQMENARMSVDESTLSAATTLAATDHMLNQRTTNINYLVFQSATVGDGGSRHITIAPAPVSAPPTGYVPYQFKSKTYTGMTITIGNGGSIVTSTLARATGP